MIWEPVLEASIEANAKWVVVEQDEHYETDPLECARRSREYLKILGWQKEHSDIEKIHIIEKVKETEK